MPKLELKVIQAELEKGILWPVYWLYGPEKLKSMELLKRIRKAVLGVESQSSALSSETFDASETSAHEIIDSLCSPSLYGGVRLVLVKDAHLLKNAESLAELFGPPADVTQVKFVCVCLAKDLDARKKFSKLLIEKAAVVPCEEVADYQKESWILYLAKRRNQTLAPALVGRLCALEPWSLDLIEQELEKISLEGDSSAQTAEGERLQGTFPESFVEGFFQRKLELTLPWVHRFAESPDMALPLLGLLGWNAKQLGVLAYDRENQSRYSKLNHFSAEQLKRWALRWTTHDLIELSKELAYLDYTLKQLPLSQLGAWSSLVTRFCSL